ncbi:uncharacterized protein LOC136025962 isoform X2 [Artemia franciscana]
MVWSHDDSWMITGDQNGFVKYWQSNMNNVKMFQAHKEPLRGISFSPSDQKFATCSDDGTVRIWDFIRCEEERILRGHGADVKCVDWHPHKGLIVSGSKDNQQPIKLWDPRTGNSLTTLHSHKSTVMDIKWNQNGNWLLTASRDHLVKVFDIRHLGTEMQIFRGHKKEASCLSWNPVHEALFASGGSDGSILFWHVGIDKEVGAIENAHDNMIWSLSWHPIGHVLASGANDHTTKFWTRNRPGDKMKDKYNLNLLPPTIAPEDAEWEDKSSFILPTKISHAMKEEKVSIFTSQDDSVLPGLDFLEKATDVTRSKVTSSGSYKGGPTEYIEFDEKNIPKEPVPLTNETKVAIKLLERSFKVMYGVKEPKMDPSLSEAEFTRLGFPDYVENPNDESEPLDVKLLPFVTHIIAAGDIIKSEGKAELFGAARNSVERFYESLAKKGYIYEHRPLPGERNAMHNLTEGEIATYKGFGPLPERHVPSPPFAPSPEVPSEAVRMDRKSAIVENFEFLGKRSRFEQQDDEFSRRMMGNNGNENRKPQRDYGERYAEENYFREERVFLRDGAGQVEPQAVGGFSQQGLPPNPPGPMMGEEDYYQEDEYMPSRYPVDNSFDDDVMQDPLQNQYVGPSPGVNPMRLPGPQYGFRGPRPPMQQFGVNPVRSAALPPSMQRFARPELQRPGLPQNQQRFQRPEPPAPRGSIQNMQRFQRPEISGPRQFLRPGLLPQPPLPVGDMARHPRPFQPFGRDRGRGRGGFSGRDFEGTRQFRDDFSSENQERNWGPEEGMDFVEPRLTDGPPQDMMEPRENGSFRNRMHEEMDFEEYREDDQDRSYKPHVDNREHYNHESRWANRDMKPQHREERGGFRGRFMRGRGRGR